MICNAKERRTNMEKRKIILKMIMILLIMVACFLGGYLIGYYQRY